MRRNRQYPWIRDLISETPISPKDFILPLFVIEGEQSKENIPNLIDVYRMSIDLIIEEVKKAADLGIKSIALFPVISAELKSEYAKEAYKNGNLISRCIEKILSLNIDIGIICDVALDPYTTHGHDGIIINQKIDNDASIEILIKQTISLAKSGAHFVAPSDMMDGRIIKIREALDAENLINTGIIAYSAKYSSNFYGPFRDALKTRSSCDKTTYQMDYRNAKEAIYEIELDISEGADACIIKPATNYLDIIYRSCQKFNTPIFAYQVSGEYMMLKFLEQRYNNKDIWLENIYSIKRAGARDIFSYAALELTKIIN